MMTKHILNMAYGAISFILLTATPTTAQQSQHPAETAVAQWQSAVRNNQCDRLKMLACSSGGALWKLTGTCGQDDNITGMMGLLLNAASDWKHVYYQFEPTGPDTGVVHYRGSLGIKNSWFSSGYTYKPIEQSLPLSGRKSNVVIEAGRWKVC